MAKGDQDSGPHPTHSPASQRARNHVARTDAVPRQGREHPRPGNGGARRVSSPARRPGRTWWGRCTSRWRRGCPWAGPAGARRQGLGALIPAEIGGDRIQGDGAGQECRQEQEKQKKRRARGAARRCAACRTTSVFAALRCAACRTTNVLTALRCAACRATNHWATQGGQGQEIEKQTEGPGPQGRGKVGGGVGPAGGNARPHHQQRADPQRGSLQGTGRRIRQPPPIPGRPGRGHVPTLPARRRAIPHRSAPSAQKMTPSQIYWGSHRKYTCPRATSPRPRMSNSASGFLMAGAANRLRYSPARSSAPPFYRQ